MSLKSKLQSRAEKFRQKLNLRTDRTFILPTGFGFAFGGISFVMLVMAIGYANNLLYFFVFLLISMAMTGMWTTNKNVDSVQVDHLYWPPLFAREENKIDLFLKTKKQLTCWDVEVKIENGIHFVELVMSHSKASLLWKPAARGFHKFPRLTLQSRFPFKMLRAWKYYQSQSEVLIFPERKGTPQIPQSAGGRASEKELEMQSEEHGLFRDLREFQRTDSPRRIDWKRSLKHQKHFVKNFESAGENKTLLTWEMTAFLNDVEARLSQLAFWVDLCHKRQEPYALRLKDELVQFQNSESHYREILTKLALYKNESAPV